MLNYLCFEKYKLGFGWYNVIFLQNLKQPFLVFNIYKINNHQLL
jgi:hypothetical protein